MGTLIRMIFREGVPKQKCRVSQMRRSAVARERGLTMWRERDDVVVAAAYRVFPRQETANETQPAGCKPLKFAPQA